MQSMRITPNGYEADKLYGVNKIRLFTFLMILGALPLTAAACGGSEEDASPSATFTAISSLPTLTPVPTSTPEPPESDPALLPAAQEHRELALELLNKQEFEAAIAEYDQAISLYPNFPEAHNNRGIAYYRLGETEKALEDFNTAIILDDKFDEAYINRGMVYLRSGQYQRAVDEYSQAILYDLDNAEAHLNRGTAYYRMGDLEEALKNHSEGWETLKRLSRITPMPSPWTQMLRLLTWAEHWCLPGWSGTAKQSRTLKKPLVWA